MSHPFSFRLLFFRPPPQVHWEETPQLSHFFIQLEERECIAWISFIWTMALDIIYGDYAALFMFHASLTFKIKTVLWL